MQDIFDRKAVRQHRERIASSLPQRDFLFREVGERLLDRLSDIRRRFPLAADLGCRSGILNELLDGRGGIETLVGCELSHAMALRAGEASRGLTLVADEEALPFAHSSLDLALSLLNLHWVNDLPGTLVQIRRALKPDGFFLAAMLGGETLKELRRALAEAEIEIAGGLSPRVSPFADVRDIGNLMQRAGFALPVVDMETIAVSYADPFALMADLRGMGESNAVRERRRGATPRSLIMAAAERYHRHFADSQGRIPATFQVIFLAGWAPDPSQQKPLSRGSGRIPLMDALLPPAPKSCGASQP